ncbi:ClpXP protease specificity-enhancing factor [Methylotenera oryzisoli]|uniref:ClpXP protease specificity-enhancing factor n=1 Tax=Methylotenera oryzisoli TaxID=2080758 RepID=A0A4Y9VRN8_9PROT|nr:ClpXP protease specificity-enhancing factor [Methylotenera oryzisoli]TFW70910.1 ClpXP protease specificity-enhancing factor [Methylotenera oryzisoli]
MSELIPTKPYMLRALHEWCVDNNLTPHLIVAVNAQTRVPMAYVKDGEIVLNINYSATKDLHIDNDSVVFSARFGGVSQNIYVPMSAVRGIFARENGQGMFFEADLEQEEVPFLTDNAKENAEPVESKEELIKSKKPVLKIVK